MDNDHVRFLLFLVPVLLAYAVGRWHQALVTRAAPTPQLSNTRELKSLVGDLRETAWDHRDIDPDLATIILDKIRTYEQGNNS